MYIKKVCNFAIVDLVVPSPDNVPVSPDVFANTRLSLFLSLEHPVGALIGLYGDTSQAGANVMYETLTDPEYGPSYGFGYSPFAYAHWQRKDLKEHETVWDWYAQCVSEIYSRLGFLEH